MLDNKDQHDQGKENDEVSILIIGGFSQMTQGHRHQINLWKGSFDASS